MVLKIKTNTHDSCIDCGAPFLSVDEIEWWYLDDRDINLAPNFCSNSKCKNNFSHPKLEFENVR